MIKRIPLLQATAFAANVLLTAGTAVAQVPEAIHYQGQVTVDDQPFDSDGAFKFAIVDDGTEHVATATATATVSLREGGLITTIKVTDGGSGYVGVPKVTILESRGGPGSGAKAEAKVEDGQVIEIVVIEGGSDYEAPRVVLEAPPEATIKTLWSNDNSSTGGSEPDGAVGLTVDHGVFNVVLGDTGRDLMNALPAEVFATSPAFLRVWFDGGNGFEQLAPDQLVTATPYAMHAKYAEFATSIPPGTIGRNQIDDSLGMWSSAGGNLVTSELVGIGLSDPRATLHVSGSMVAGHSSNNASGQFSFAGGGSGNTAAAQYAYVGGGEDSEAGGTGSFVGGGSGNTASGTQSFVGGGSNNTAGGGRSFVGGGSGNTAGGSSSFVAGGENNVADSLWSFAAGRRAKAVHTSTFVWADRTNADFASTGMDQFLIRARGGVGIGTNNPINGELHVAATNSSTGVYGENSSTIGVTHGVRGRSDSSSGRGVSGFATADTGVNYGVHGQVASTSGRAVYGRASATTGNAIGVRGRTDSPDGYAGYFTGGRNYLEGNVGIGTSDPQQALHVNGTTRTKVLQITGADLAEEFPFSEQAEPGMVVAIDPGNPGELCISRGKYNRLVAGIIAGANEFKTGVVLGHESCNEFGNAVALSGRVYVNCDASEHAIEPGDMLTTADLPGHARKVNDFQRAQGAIIGKAMEGLAQGEHGMILVLVNLQ